MRLPRVSSWLPSALVLVPALGLAWLGFSAILAGEDASAARLAHEVDAAADALREMAREERQSLLAALDSAAAEAVTAIHRRAPGLGLSGAVALAERGVSQAVGLPDTRIQVFALDGRRLHPRPFVPVDSAVRGDPDAPSLFRHLRAEADRAYYGSGGLDAAVAVWTDARERFHSALRRATADTEIARLRLRGADAAQAAALAADLDGTGDMRPLVLFWVRAAEVSSAGAAELGALQARPEWGAVPLTDVERLHARRVAVPVRRTSFDDADEHGSPLAHRLDVYRAVTSRAEVDGVLRVEVDASVRALRALVTERLLAYDLPFPVTVKQSEQDLDAVGFETLTIDFLGPLEDDGEESGAIRLWVRHGHAARLRATRLVRRWVFSLGVLGLFLLVLQGVRLTRRAVRREQDAIALRDEFIQNVTHEVRTPLTSVLMHAEMLAEDGVPEARRQAYARVVEAEGARLAALIDDLLDFAALERGQRVLELEPMDLGAAMTQAVEPFRVLAERDGVTLTLDVPQDVVVAFADPHAVSRILANLVGNAWKYGCPARDGAPGRLQMTVRDTRDGPVAEVRDDGPGIAPDEREQVFERFGRGRGVGGKAGAGLGLALSRDLARQQGGALTVEEDGDETIFRLRLRTMGEDLA